MPFSFPERRIWLVSGLATIPELTDSTSCERYFLPPVVQVPLSGAVNLCYTLIAVVSDVSEVSTTKSVAVPIREDSFAILKALAEGAGDVDGEVTSTPQPAANAKAESDRAAVRMRRIVVLSLPKAVALLPSPSPTPCPDEIG